MSQKNVLELCLSPDLGGLELYMLNCYKYFKEKNNVKMLIAPNGKLDTYVEHEINFYLKRNKYFPVLPALKLSKFIDENEIDIVHFHWTRDIATVVLAKLLSKRKPDIIQTRHMTMTRFKNDFYHKWLYKHIKKIHAITYQVKEQLERYIPNDIRPKLEMVYIGTKEQPYNPIRIQELRDKYDLGTSFVVGIVGRIEEAKGQYLLLEAVAKLVPLDIKLLIVGDTMDNEYLDSLQERVKHLDIVDRVVFTGFTKEVTEHMKLFDISVLATPKETFGLVIIESMMNKVCVIATNLGGPLEIIDDGVNGLLFNRTVEDLVDKISTLYHNPILKNKLALAGYQKAKEVFDADVQLDTLWSIMNES